MQGNLHMQTATWLVKREISDAAGPWDTRLLGDDDGEYFCRILMASTGVRFARDAKVFYRASGIASLSYIGGSARKADAQWCSMKLHVKYLRSLEESSRVRAACLQYLQNWLPTFYPTSVEILNEINDLANELGGSLSVPELSWKYSWIRNVCGWETARRAQIMLPAIRWSVQRYLDRLFARAEGYGRGSELGV
jgi:hypothetical protein